MPKSVLVCAAHPDDEVLGCGGAIARHTAEGDKVQILFFTDGVSARENNLSIEGQDRQKAANEAVHILGAEVVGCCYFPDQQLETVPLLKLTKILERYNPNIIYTHHLGDLNLDHHFVAQAVLTAFRPLPGSTVEAIYGFETLSSTEWAFEEIFVPTRFVAIDIEKKLAALKEYQSEMRDFPHPRSYDGVRALAMLRGMTVGLRAAEAFTVLRQIIA